MIRRYGVPIIRINVLPYSMPCVSEEESLFLYMTKSLKTDNQHEMKYLTFI